MDVFKLAFETIVVGLLAFLWLGVAIYLLSPDFLTDLVSRRLPAFAKDNPTLLSVALLTLAYCLGSAILPIANQLVNDEHWPLSESAVRCQVFTQQQRLLDRIKFIALPNNPPASDFAPHHCSYWAPVFEGKIRDGIWVFLQLWAPPLLIKQHQSALDDETKKDRLLSLFQLQESKLLNQGSDTAVLLRQLHERIVVLRGAVFSGFVLSLICLFAYFARVYGQPSHWIKTICGALLAICFAAFAFLNGCQDLMNKNIFDIPVLEGLVAVITIFGAILIIRGVKTQLFMKKRYLFAIIFFALLAYGGWMSSEIIYDQQVIGSLAVPQGSPETQQH